MRERRARPAPAPRPRPPTRAGAEPGAAGRGLHDMHDPLPESGAPPRPSSAPRPARGRPARAARALAAALVLLLAGCAAQRAAPEADEGPKYLEPGADDQRSLVFGYLDMRQAPTALGWIEFRQVLPRTDTPYYQMRVHEGVFYMEKFPTGTFAMGEFGGRRRDGQQLAYSLPRNSPAVRIAIDRPGLHFVGAFRYRPLVEDGSQPGRFAIDAVDAPSESEVLARILPYARGTGWEPRIRARLAGGR